LTDKGREKARKLVKTHRLWEVYLHTHLDTPHVHSTAHRLEHSIDETQLHQMDQELDYPDIDPHGTPIPRE
jgi:Mn-dependent DtxR family transcriptional regulator